MVVAGTAGAQTIPQLAVEVSVGQGGHTYRTAKDSFTTPNAEINRLAAALRVGPERAFTPVIMLESSIGNGRNGTDAVGGSCFVARCPRAFPGPSGLAVGLEGRGSWTRLTFGAGGGLGALPHFTRYVSANAAVRVFSTWSVLVDMRHLWTTSDNGEAIIFHPLSFGIRYGHNTEE
jgi:hypothetical protein